MQLEKLGKVEEIIKSYGGDKEYLIQILLDVQKEFRWLSHDVLARVSENWRVPLPAGVLERLRTLCASPGEKRVDALLSGPHRVVHRLWAVLRGIRGWGARIRYVWGSLFPSVAYMRRNYDITHRILTPLYYPYRWLRALRRVR